LFCPVVEGGEVEAPHKSRVVKASEFNKQGSQRKQPVNLVKYRMLPRP